MARNHRKRNVFFWLAASTSFFFVVGLAALLFVSPVFRIKEITIDGLRTVSEEGIRNNIDEFFKNKTFAIAGFTLFHGDNILLLSKSELAKSIQNEFPKIGEINIKKHLKPKLSLAIAERQPFAVWCALLPQLSASRASTELSRMSPQESASVSDCFWMSADGVIYESAPRLSGTAFLSITSEISDGSFKLGEAVIPPRIMDFISGIDSAFLGKIGIRAKEWRVLSKGSEELSLKTEEGWETRFASTRQAEGELQALSRLLSEIIKEKRPELSYIDLRDSSRLYYRLRSETTGNKNPFNPL